MPRLLETIRISEGVAQHLSYHQQRLDYSRKRLGFDFPLTLKLTPPSEGEFRCRVLYEKEIEQIEYIAYQKKEIHTFKIIHSDISYELKYENRDQINALLEQKGEADDIIIVKNGLITDTSIANLCIFDGKEWLTPKLPLLKGTTRQRLLDEQKIRCTDIHYHELNADSKIATMNAMTGFYIIDNAIIL